MRTAKRSLLTFRSKEFLFRSCLSIALLISIVAGWRLALAGQPEWRIGVILCFSGECSSTGDMSRKAIELAAKELNDQGGVLGKRITFSFEDAKDAVSGAGAVSAFRHLRLNPEIKYFIGPSLTPSGLALAPIVSKDLGIVITSPSLGVKEFNEAGDNIFNTRGADESSTRDLARYALRRGWRRGAIFSSQQAWEFAQGNFFEDEFQKGGGQIAVKVEPSPDTIDIRGEAARILREKPDFVFLCDYLQVSTAAKDLRGLGFRGPKLATYIDDSRLQTADGALEGTIFATYPESDVKFRSAFEAAYHQQPDQIAALSYDTMKAYADAVVRSGTFDVDDFKKAFLATRYDGAAGPLRFDEKGGAIRKPVLRRILEAGTESVSANESPNE